MDKAAKNFKGFEKISVVFKLVIGLHQKNDWKCVAFELEIKIVFYSQGISVSEYIFDKVGNCGNRTWTH